MCRSDIHHLTVKLYILYWINLLIIYHYWTSDWLNRDQVSIVIFRYSFAPETWLMRTISVSETGQGLSLAPLEPRIYRTRGLTNAKLIFVLMKHVASLVVRFLFSASFSDSRLKNMLHSRLIPPKHEKTSGVDEAFPTSTTLAAYLTFFSFSCCSWTLAKALVR